MAAMLVVPLAVALALGVASAVVRSRALVRLAGLVTAVVALGSGLALLATGQIIFGIIVIGLIGLVSDFLFKAVNSRLFRWRLA